MRRNFIRLWSKACSAHYRRKGGDLGNRRKEKRGGAGSKREGAARSIRRPSRIEATSRCLRGFPRFILQESWKSKRRSLHFRSLPRLARESRKRFLCGRQLCGGIYLCAELPRRIDRKQHSMRNEVFKILPRAYWRNQSESFRKNANRPNLNDNSSNSNNQKHIKPKKIRLDY